MQTVLSATRKVFISVSYVGLALLVSAIVFTTSIWLQNFALVWQVLGLNSISLTEKLSFLFSLYGSIATNFSNVAAAYTILIALLFGMSISMFAYYIKQQQGAFSGKSSATSIGGLISGFFGIGCAACGTFLLSSMLGLFGAASLLAFFPLGGEEFGLLGVVLLGFSVFKTAEMIEKPKVCAQKQS